MKQGVRLARVFFSFISLGLVANTLLFQETTDLDVKVFIVILQVAIFVLSSVDWYL